MQSRNYTDVKGGYLVTFYHSRLCDERGRIPGEAIAHERVEIRAVQEAESEPTLQGIQEMAIVDPDQRASAAEMLDKYFKGEGRSTPRSQSRDDIPPSDKIPSIPEREPLTSSRHVPTKLRVKSIKQHHPLDWVKCPRCSFEGKKVMVVRHAKRLQHVSSRKGAETLLDPVVEKLLT